MAAAGVPAQAARSQRALRRSCAHNRRATLPRRVLTAQSGLSWYVYQSDGSINLLRICDRELCIIEIRLQCRGRLRDFILDWEDALPEEQLEAADKHSDQAELFLCLGTSLQIVPICNLPLRTKRKGGTFAIVNLQKTPKDKHADLVVHAKCDDVMRRVMALLECPIPSYVRRDVFSLRMWCEAESATEDELDEVRSLRPVPDSMMAHEAGCARERVFWVLGTCQEIHSRKPIAEHKLQAELQLAVVLQDTVVTVALGSSHGMACPMPMLHSAQWAFAANETSLARLPPAAPLPGLETNGVKREGADMNDAHEPTDAAHANGSRRCKKRRLVDEPARVVPELHADGHTPWQRACVSEGVPVLMQLTLTPSQLAQSKLLLTVHLHFTDAADADLRQRAVLLRLDTDNKGMLAQRPGGQTGGLWGSAAATAVQLSVVTQVRMLTALAHASNSRWPRLSYAN